MQRFQIATLAIGHLFACRCSIKGGGTIHGTATRGARKRAATHLRPHRHTRGPRQVLQRTCGLEHLHQPSRGPTAASSLVVSSFRCKRRGSVLSTKVETARFARDPPHGRKKRCNLKEAFQNETSLV